MIAGIPIIGIVLILAAVLICIFLYTRKWLTRGERGKRAVADVLEQSGLYYRERINNIRQAKIRGEVILAKPVLLLSLIDGVNEGVFRNNLFVLNGWLEKHYESLMRKYTKQSIFDNITPINNPFWHLQSDGFWHLHYNGAQPTIINTPSVRWLEDNVNYASFDDDLWTLLQDRTSRQQLREFIVEHKLPKVK